MKKFHPFFAIGTIGLIVSASIHIFFALGLSLTTIHTIFFTLYPVFLTFILVGVMLTIKKQRIIE